MVWPLREPFSRWNLVGLLVILACPWSDLGNVESFSHLGGGIRFGSVWVNGLSGQILWIFRSELAPIEILEVVYCRSAGDLRALSLSHCSLEFLECGGLWKDFWQQILPILARNLGSVWLKGSIGKELDISCWLCIKLKGLLLDMFFDFGLDYEFDFDFLLAFCCVEIISLLNKSVKESGFLWGIDLIFNQRSHIFLTIWHPVVYKRRHKGTIETYPSSFSFLSKPLWSRELYFGFFGASFLDLISGSVWLRMSQSKRLSSFWVQFTLHFGFNKVATVAFYCNGGVAMRRWLPVNFSRFFLGFSVIGFNWLRSASCCSGMWFIGKDCGHDPTDYAGCVLMQSIINTLGVTRFSGSGIWRFGIIRMEGLIHESQIFLSLVKSDNNLFISELGFKAVEIQIYLDIYIIRFQEILCSMLWLFSVTYFRFSFGIYAVVYHGIWVFDWCWEFCFGGDSVGYDLGVNSKVDSDPISGSIEAGASLPIDDLRSLGSDSEMLPKWKINLKVMENPVEVHGGSDLGFAGSRWFGFQFWFGRERIWEGLRYFIFQFIGFINYILRFRLVFRGRLLPTSGLSLDITNQGALGHWVLENALLFQRMEKADLSGQQPLQSRVHL